MYAHTQRFPIRPRTLQGEGTGHRVQRGREHRRDTAVSARPGQPYPAVARRLLEEDVELGHSWRHHIGRGLLEACRPLNIGEQHRSRPRSLLSGVHARSWKRLTDDSGHSFIHDAHFAPATATEHQR
jgi:hypothetical protein